MSLQIVKNADKTETFVRPMSFIPNTRTEEVSAAEKFATKAHSNSSLVEAMDNAGLNWKIETKKLYTNDGIEVPNKAIVRQDTQAILGVVGRNYTPVQNEQAFGFFSDFIDSGKVTIKNAGMIGGGKRVFIQAEVNNSEASIIGDDVVNNILTIGKAHDGSMSLNVGFTPIRMFCANQLSMVTQKANGTFLKFRHTPKIHENLEQIAAILNQADVDFQKTIANFKILASKKITSQAELEHYIKTIFVGSNYIELIKAGKSPANQIITNVVNLFESGRGSSKTANTYWKAYNAVNEYLNHERGSDDQKRFDSISFGDSKKIDNIALRVALAA